jgi:hypothetical protein
LWFKDPCTFDPNHCRVVPTNRVEATVGFMFRLGSLMPKGN